LGKISITLKMLNERYGLWVLKKSRRFAG
jgi:hypothetical protein